ncbi:MAG: hypothetical protein ACJ71A_10115 [Nitrososphaeraceae archaeon]
MKKFSLALIPTLAVIMSALLVTIFSTTINIANADSFPFSPMLQSPVQLQLPIQQQQHPLDTNGMMITTNSNEPRLTDHPLLFSSLLPPLQQSQSQSSQPQQQQYQNQTTQQQPLDTNEMNNSHHKNKLDNHSPSIVSILPALN